jgi:hypothetical protein
VRRNCTPYWLLRSDDVNAIASAVRIEVINWSYILKYLLSSSTKLRKELKEQQRSATHVPVSSAHLSGAGDVHRVSQSSAGVAAGARLGGGITRQALEELQAGQLDAAGSEIDDSEYSQGAADGSSRRRSTQQPAHSNGRRPVASTGEQAPPAGTKSGGSQEVSRAPPRWPQRAADSPLRPFSPAADDHGQRSPPYSSLDEAEYMSQTSTIQTRPSMVGDARGRPSHDSGRSSREPSNPSYRSYPSASNGSGFPAGTPYQPANSQHQYAVYPSSAQSAAPRRELRSEYDSPLPHPHLSQYPQPHPQQQDREELPLPPPPRSRPQSVQSAASASVAGTQRSSHSTFARGVVQDLGVERTQAAAAMAVVDKVAQITDEQLAQLDQATRDQILQIRRELGLEAPRSKGTGRGRTPSGRESSAPSSRSSTPTSLSAAQQGVRNLHYYDGATPHSPQQQKPRASSAPRQRSMSSGSASLLSQQSQQQQRGRPAPSPAYRQRASNDPRSQHTQQRHAQVQPAADYGHYGNYFGGEDEDDDNFSQLDM